MLDEKVKQRGLLEQGPFPVPAESVSALQDSYADLVEAISKYEEIVEHLEQMWQEKVGILCDTANRNMFVEFNLAVRYYFSL